MKIALRDVVEVRIVNGTAALDFMRKQFRAPFLEDGNDLVFRAPASAGSSAGEQLNWLYAMLETHRNLFRQLEGAGLLTVCRIRFAGRTLVLPPEGVRLAHFLHIATEIEHVD